MNIELKPCPFCGSGLNAHSTVTTIRPATSDGYLRWKIRNKKIIGSDAYYVVICPQCSATGQRGSTREVAAALWNKRIGDDNGTEIRRAYANAIKTREREKAHREQQITLY